MNDHPTSGGRQWRFEAVDLRAGMGITLWRNERTKERSLPPDHAPALYFCPPHFRPEPVVNIAMALSACRGTFAPGLYIDEFEGPEASFRTPAEVGEFLRRAYVGGAGGDGGDGADILPAPPQPEGGGEPGPELSPGFESALVYHLQRGIGAFQEAARGLEPGASASFSWEEGGIVQGDEQTGSGAPPYADHDALVAAAEALLSEMMRRMPSHAYHPDWLRWHDDLRDLANSLCAFGVAELLNPTRITESMMGRLAQRGFPWGEGLDDEERHLLCWYLLFGPAEPPLYRWPDLHHWLREWRFWQHRLPLFWSEPPRVAGLEDPFDLLLRLPAPRVLQCRLPEDIGEDASLFHLLHVFLAEPQAFAPDPRLAICLAVFASACIASSRRAYQPPLPWALRALPDMYRNERARKSTERAYAWLIENMPQRVYAQAYEKNLGRSKHIRYFVERKPG